MLWNNSLIAVCQGKHVWPTAIQMGIHKYNTHISFLNGAYNILWEQSMIRDSLIIMETRLWAGQSKVSFPAGERDFSVLQNVQTSSGAYWTSYSLDTRVLTQGKGAGVWCYHISPSSAKVKNDWCCTFTPPVCHHGAHWDSFTFY